jgi:hypothetical protein
MIMDNPCICFSEPTWELLFVSRQRLQSFELKLHHLMYNDGLAEYL